MNLTAMNYYGGKARTDFRSWLLPKIPYNKYGFYVEPFAGMLGVLLARPKCNREIVGDLDINIVNWWRVIREHPDELEHLIRYTPKCRRTFDECVKAIEDNTYRDNPILWAWATFMILQHGISHGMNHTAFSISYQVNPTRDFASIIKPLSERVRGMEIVNIDALDTIRMFDLPNAVIYCDPPYLNATTRHYGNNHLDIDAFTDAFLSQRGKVAISGYADEWDHLGWHKHEWNTKAPKINYVQEYESENWERTECLWTNYALEANQLELQI